MSKMNSLIFPCKTLTASAFPSKHVVVRLRDDRKYTAVSAQTFTYTNPQITSFQPLRGPRNGGTDLTVPNAQNNNNKLIATPKRFSALISTLALSSTSVWGRCLVSSGSGPLRWRFAAPDQRRWSVRNIWC